MTTIPKQVATTLKGIKCQAYDYKLTIANKVCNKPAIGTISWIRPKKIYLCKKHLEDKKMNWHCIEYL